MQTTLMILATLAAGPLSEKKPKPLFIPAPIHSIYVGPMAGRPVVGDLNKDGKLDVVVACGPCCGSAESPESGHLVALLGDGKGGFMRPGMPLKVGPTARKVALGDVNGDGILDAVVAEHSTYKVSILIGNGKGEFKPAGSPVLCGSGERPHVHDVSLADINGDSKLDLLTTNPNDHVVSVMAGDGKGGFKHMAGSPFQLASHPYDAICAVDMNQDGKLDIVLPDLGAKRVSVTFGDGTGQFSKASRTLTMVDDRPGYVAVGDLNKDGFPDVVATHDDASIVDVLLNDGKGTLTQAGPLKFASRGFAWGVAVGDVDADGNVDLVLGLAGGNQIVVMRGDGRGAFQQDPASPYKADDSADHVTLGDFNGDGNPDIVTGNYKAGTISVLLNTLPRRTKL